MTSPSSEKTVSKPTGSTAYMEYASSQCFNTEIDITSIPNSYLHEWSASDAKKTRIFNLQER
jgi:hypothetical protein